VSDVLGFGVVAWLMLERGPFMRLSVLPKIALIDTLGFDAEHQARAVSQVTEPFVADDELTMGWLVKGTVEAKRLYWKNMPSGTTPRLPAGVIQVGADIY
jgi:hypothetical protein